MERSHAEEVHLIGESRAVGAAPDQLRSNGEEELVDEAGLKHRAHQLRPALCQDPAVPPSPEGIDP
jgi:hypothetical protein